MRLHVNMHRPGASGVLRLRLFSVGPMSESGRTLVSCARGRVRRGKMNIQQLRFVGTAGDWIKCAHE